MFTYLISLVTAFATGYYFTTLSKKSSDIYTLFQLYHKMLPSVGAAAAETLTTMIEVTAADLEQFLMQTCREVSPNVYLLKYKINSKRYELLVRAVNGPDVFSPLERGKQSIHALINDNGRTHSTED